MNDADFTAVLVRALELLQFERWMRQGHLDSHESSDPPGTYFYRDLAEDDAERWLRQNDPEYGTRSRAWRGAIPTRWLAPSRGAGRPARGWVGEMAARALLRALPHYTITELGECCRARRKIGRWASMHDELAVVVATLPLNHAGLAELFGCSQRTIERLLTKGVGLTTQERIAAALERQADATERLAQVVEFRWPTQRSITREVDEFIASALKPEAA